MQIPVGSPGKGLKFCISNQLLTGALDLDHILSSEVIHLCGRGGAGVKGEEDLGVVFLLCDIGQAPSISRPSLS